MKFTEALPVIDALVNKKPGESAFDRGAFAFQQLFSSSSVEEFRHMMLDARVEVHRQAYGEDARRFPLKLIPLLYSVSGVVLRGVGGFGGMYVAQRLGISDVAPILAGAYGGGIVDQVFAKRRSRLG